MALAVRGYLSRDEENVRSLNTVGENGTGSDEIVADGPEPVVNIHLPSNAGTVVVGKNPTVRYANSDEGENREKVKNGTS